jgi:CheY-like chemotaxis protein
LLLEDDSDALELLQALLVSGNFEVVVASQPAQARAILERQAFDLVIADLLFGTREIDQSWTTLDELAALARPTPVGVMTAWQVEPERLARHGLAFVLQKPCRRSQLFAQIADALHLPPLSPTRIAILRAYFESLEARAYDVLGGLCTDDVVYELPGSHPRLSTIVEGKAAFLAFTEQTFQTFRAPHFEVAAMRPLPNGAVVEYAGTWRDATSNETHSIQGAVMFRFRDSRIAHIAIRLDADLIP